MLEKCERPDLDVFDNDFRNFYYWSDVPVGPKTAKVQDSFGIYNFEVLGKEMAIPDFGFFCQTLHTMYEKCALNKDGQVACYIPQLGTIHILPKHL